MITGRRGSGKTSVAIKLFEDLQKEALKPIDFSIQRECTLFIPKGKNLFVFPSLEAIPLSSYPNMGILIETYHIDREKKEIHAKVYLHSEDTQYLIIKKVFHVIIPFCSFKSYKVYSDAMVKKLENWK